MPYIAVGDLAQGEPYQDGTTHDIQGTLPYATFCLSYVRTRILHQTIVFGNNTFGGIIASGLAKSLINASEHQLDNLFLNATFITFLEHRCTPQSSLVLLLPAR